MSRKLSRSLAAGLVAAALAVSFGTPGAAAASRHRHHRTGAAPRAHHGYVVNRGYRFDPQNPEGYGYVNIPPNAIVGPGYVFVPGVGILGKSCDMPTSACPNAYRDIQ